jgi:hypothetical protein
VGGDPGNKGAKEDADQDRRLDPAHHQEHHEPACHDACMGGGGGGAGAMLQLMALAGKETSNHVLLACVVRMQGVLLMTHLRRVGLHPVTVTVNTCQAG